MHSSHQLPLSIEPCPRRKQNDAIQSNDSEERADVDGGLGSSVCGEDLINVSSLADAAVLKQHKTGNGVEHTQNQVTKPEHTDKIQLIKHENNLCNYL